MSLTSYKRINTVDLSLARINYDLKIFMRETKFVLIYIFLILRSFNGYWSPSLKIPVKPKSADMQWIQTQYRLSLERWKVKWTEFLWVNVFFLFDLPSLVTQSVYFEVDQNEPIFILTNLQWSKKDWQWLRKRKETFLKFKSLFCTFIFEDLGN